MKVFQYFIVFFLVFMIAYITYIDSKRDRTKLVLMKDSWECTEISQSVMYINGQPRYINSCVNYKRKL